MRSIPEHAAKTFDRGRAPHPPSFQDQIDELRVELVRSDKPHPTLNRRSTTRHAQADPRVFAPAGDAQRIGEREEIDRPCGNHVPGPHRSLTPVVARADDHLLVFGEGVLECGRKRQADAAAGRR